eukprot:TRINITY_DN127_c0_g1_i22.p1 TRINITY_DN127_c0_g1~~TRINITY_DN127_c0_g1_i22.p1  ORF type:complete len:717 (+),score=255.71 TRINITY_DN127_c0_g1_i22:416-2566(+)
MYEDTCSLWDWSDLQRPQQGEEQTSQHDFTCTCDEDTTIVQVDGPARCAKDECNAKPCGAEQSCNDPDTAAGSKNDFTCTCIKTLLNVTGQAVPNCGTDECVTNPCGTGQGCEDPNMLVTGDFECSCPFGSEHNKGAPVEKCDECAVGNVGSPCTWVGHPEVTETCSDPNPAADSLNDFVCTCPNGVSMVGGPAECETTGECASKPCGDFQVCSDPDLNKDGDFMCSCSVGEGTMTGGPATCVYDECKAKGQSLSPCPVLTQECSDPNTSPGSTLDFVCSCKDGPNGEKINASKVGGAANCAGDTNAPDTEAPMTMAPADECSTNPCDGQECSDPTGAATTGDFVCTCKSKGTTKTGGPVAGCTDFDECQADPAPCGKNQMCNDPSPVVSSKKDFVCTCNTNNKTMTAAPVSDCPVPATDAPVSPPTTAAPVTHDDECAKHPCNGQECYDPTGMSTEGDFMCTCEESEETKVGAPVASCGVKDECKAGQAVCGDFQDCEDKNTKKNSLHDFVCSCKVGYEGHSTVGRATTCTMKTECSSDPCGGQECTDATGMATLGDYVCSCAASGKTMKGAKVANCDTLDECLGNPCGDGEKCVEGRKTKNSLKDYTCSCMDGSGVSNRGGPVLLGCDGYALSPLNLQAAGGNDKTPVEESSSSSTPAWIWLLIIAASLAACGGLAFTVWKRHQGDVTMQEFIDGVSEVEPTQMNQGPREHASV